MVATADSVLAALIGSSQAMAEVRARIRRIGPSSVPVLIIGETGTGKELCASAIAAMSGTGIFVPVNCAAFPESLADSELFGYERGAFTGAHRDHDGLIAHVSNGVLFLDELAELPAAVQAKLLRTFESGEYRRVGSPKVRHSRFRILAAISAEPEILIESGKLRLDLIHRLGALRIRLPPLRERPEDIPVLAAEFLRQYCERMGLPPAQLAPSAVRLLMDQSWPGNVRQLRNVIEAGAASADDPRELGLEALLPVVQPDPAMPDYSASPTLKDTLREAERRSLLEAIARSGGNRERAARQLGISAATFYRKFSYHYPEGLD